VNIISIDPQHDALWQKLVNKHRSDVFHSPAWINVLNATYDFDIKALVVLDDDGEPRSGLAYGRIEDMMDPRIASLPFSDFCDPLVNDPDDWDALFTRLLAEDCRLNLRCLHNDLPLSEERLTFVNRAKWHCIDLRREVDDLWMGMDGAARRAIKKAQRQGITVRVAQDKDDLRAFFLLHLKLRKYKYNLLAQSYSFFENIWDNFIPQGHGALMVAVYEDQVIGGVFFLEWQNKFYYKFNASDQDQVTLRPNDLVVWEGMQYGREKGYDYLDFGLSDWDQEGLLQYKRKFATEEKTISFLRYTPDGAPGDKEKQIRKLLPQLTDLLAHNDVPDEVTEKAGDLLYQYFI
jgi:CelD/BcsL family acetyltransferase involved in cellulose biosynthesis